MHQSSPFSWQLTALTLTTLGLGLLLIPDDLAQPLRKTLRDVARPGQVVTMFTVDQFQAGWQEIQAWRGRLSDIARLSDDLKKQHARNAEIQQQLAQLQRALAESKRQQQEKFTAQTVEPLFQPDLVSARVLGKDTVALHAGRKILGAGTAKGVGENLLVVDGLNPILDVGKDQGVTLHLPVFAAHAIVGRTSNCGAYSCSLQPVTDAKFSGSAQLMRPTASGLQEGPQGVVEGTGQKTCRLTGIWRREPVDVGDEVYTAADDPLIPSPMYYGKVVRAELPEGAAHWTIEIEPAANEIPLKHVQILRPRDNPQRILAN